MTQALHYPSRVEEHGVEVNRDCPHRSCRRGPPQKDLSAGWTAGERVQACSLALDSQPFAWPQSGGRKPLEVHAPPAVPDDDYFSLISCATPEPIPGRSSPILGKGQRVRKGVDVSFSSDVAPWANLSSCPIDVSIGARQVVSNRIVRPTRPTAKNSARWSI